MEGKVMSISDTSTDAEHDAFLDRLVRKYTVANTLAGLCDLAKGYLPSIYGGDRRETRALADAYDAYQARRGDPRRAFRGGKSRDALAVRIRS